MLRTSIGSFAIATLLSLATAGVAQADDGPFAAGTTINARSGITFGGGLGFGHIGCDGADCDGVNDAGSLDVHVGGMYAPGMALVADLWGMSHSDGDNATFSQGIFTAGIRVWLVPRLWIQGGLGVAEARWHYSSEFIDFESRSDTVPAVMGAIGVELLSSPTFALDLTLRGGTGFFEDDVQVRNLSLGVGVNWY
jgi:hypothetical protein